MRYLTAILLTCIISSLCFCVVHAADYRLQPGDIVAIDVWGYEELSRNSANGNANAAAGIVIRPDGKLAFPLAGEIDASGVTPKELTRIITERLACYIVDPKVSVNIIKFHTIRIYVLGEVNRPGLYEIEKQHNLLDAIGMASGYTKDAAKKKVFIIRKDKANEPLKANLLELLKKGDITQNYVLEDGDVVFLNSNGRIDFGRDIMPWITAGYYVHDIKK